MAASAIVLAGVWEVANTYRRMAPSLADLREHDRGDTAQRQQLLDADITVGGVTLIAAVSISLAAKSPIPGVIVVASFAWVATYHHLVQKGLTSGQLAG